MLAPIVVLCLAGCGNDSDQGADPTPTVTVTESVPGTGTPSGSTASASPPSSTPTDTPTSQPTESTELSSPPETYDDALAHLAAATGERTELDRFESPSHNIYCVIQNEFIPASCELARGAIKDAEYCGEGPSQFIGRIEFTDVDPQPVCNSDTIRETGASVLPYGGTASYAGSSIMCVSEQIGVTCVDSSRTQGFFLAKGNYTVFTAG